MSSADRNIRVFFKPAEREYLMQLISSLTDNERSILSTRVNSKNIQATKEAIWSQIVAKFVKRNPSRTWVTKTNLYNLYHNQMKAMKKQMARFKSHTEISIKREDQEDEDSFFAIDGIEDELCVNDTFDNNSAIFSEVIPFEDIGCSKTSRSISADHSAQKESLTPEEEEPLEEDVERRAQLLCERKLYLEVEILELQKKQAEQEIELNDLKIKKMKMKIDKLDCV